MYLKGNHAAFGNLRIFLNIVHRVVSIEEELDTVAAGDNPVIIPAIDVGDLDRQRRWLE